jgi:putative DNA primase/helicase
VNEVIFHIKVKTYISRDEVDSNKYLIHLKNGIFDLKEMKLKEFTPEIIATTQLPITYNETADCPKIKKFLSEILAEKDIPIIQELFGYCLLKDYPIQKAVMFLGNGSNGKSTLLALFKSFLGNRNVASISLQAFDNNRFASASLYGKLANIHADIPKQPLSQTGQFKMLTGGDLISAEKKFKEIFNFVNYAKLIFSANELPKTYDESNAFFRRWIIINFPNVFEGDKADKHLIKKLTTEEELSGLFNYAVQGLKRLLESGEFSNTLTTDEIRDKYERMSSPLHAFVKDCIDVNPEEWVSKDDLYSAFIQYCEENNLPKMAKNIVGRELPKFVAMIRDERRTVAGKRKTGWRGIKIVKGVKKEEYRFDTEMTEEQMTDEEYKRELEDAIRLNEEIAKTGKVPFKLIDEEVENYFEVV